MALHQVIDAVFVDFAEAKSLIEGLGGVVFLDVNADRLSERAGEVEKVVEKGGAEAAAAVLRQQGDVDNPKIVVVFGHIEATDVLALGLDDPAGGVGVVLIVVGRLRVELLGEKDVDLFLGPSGDG